ncbi:MAG TPA: hypothetical protein VNO70_05840 [Blastocatellia bacterium]|nr:hypothetical protein [Blastocatellia bacterium]
MKKQGEGWISVLSNNDTEALWTKLYNLISSHSAIRSLYSLNRYSYERLKDIYCDLTQDLFLRLYEKKRWQFYLDSGYTDEAVDHELYHIEIPNLISQLLRERYPESYRLARRTSILLQTRPEFRRCAPASSRTADGNGSAAPRYRLGLQVYGLSAWPADKPMKSERQILELSQDVAPRMRDTRRTGRGSGSQIIISKEQLAQLMMDIFTAIDSPVNVRMLRQLVLSKLTIEDTWFVSIDAEAEPDMQSESKLPPVELADDRPTPEQILLEKEAKGQAEVCAEILLGRMKKAVRNKPQRYEKMLRIVWHCHYAPTRLSQTKVARLLGISDSLVSHYLKIYDDLIHGLDVTIEEFIYLHGAFGEWLKYTVGEMRHGNMPTKEATVIGQGRQPFFVPVPARAAVAGRHR